MKKDSTLALIFFHLTRHKTHPEL